MKFKVTVFLKDVAVYEKLTEAMVDFFTKIKEAIADGTSWQALETTNFIVMIDEDGAEYPAEFYDVRDFACENGVLKDGQIVKDAPEPPADAIRFFFLRKQLDYIGAQVERELEREDSRI